MAEKETNEPKIEQILLDLLSNSLFNRHRPVSCSSEKWRLVWREAHMQAVSLITFSGKAPENCDDNLLALIRAKLKTDLQAVIHINKQHIRLNKILTDAHIPYVILKGAASASYYPDPLMRSMGDVDFLIDENDVERACEILEKNGLIRNPKEHEKHIVYYDDNGNFELHTTPAGVPKGKDGDNIRSLFKDIIKESYSHETDFGTIQLPSPFHHGLILLLHTCCHLSEGGIGLRQLCDWAVFVASFTDDEFCDTFKDKLKKVGLWNLAKVLTKASTDYLGAPAFKWAMDTEKALTEGIIMDIFKSGNLGQKKATTVQESIFVSHENSKVARIKHIFNYLNSIVYFYWGFTKKIKLLLPFGWFYFGLRYIFRSLMGQRPKIDLKNLKSEATIRSELYEEIKLFKEE